MKKRFIHFAVLSLFMVFVLPTDLFAGSPFYISGWVRKDDKAVRNARIQVYYGQELVKEARSNRWGNFEIDLCLQKDYTLVVSAEGSAPKRIAFHSSHAEQIKGKDHFFEFIVDIFSENSSSENIFTEHLVRYDQTRGEFMYVAPFLSENTPTVPITKPEDEDASQVSPATK